MRGSEKTVRVWEVLYDVDGDGRFGDGLATFRTRDERNARDHAARSTCYGRPAEANPTDAPRSVARRWGLA